MPTNLVDLEREVVVCQTIQEEYWPRLEWLVGGHIIVKRVDTILRKQNAKAIKRGV